MKRKNTVLIVDDMEMNRSMLADMLESEYDIMEASNGVEAIALLQEKSNEIALLLLDLVMPEMDGFEVLSIMNQNGLIDYVPTIIISSETTPFYINHAYDLGATDYISRPFNEQTIKKRVLHIIMLYSKQNMLEAMVAEQLYQKEKSNFLMVEILSNIVEFRNGESGLHVRHIRILTEILLQKLQKLTDKYDISASKAALIVNASAIHDIGKISIPEEILNKPGRLTGEEFEIMKTHSAMGAHVLEDVLEQHPEDFLSIAHNICRWHHERYDGRGYPDGLKGEEIPIEAQIVALADVYDALTSERIYKAAFSHEKAIQMILNGECGTFSPLLLDCLKEVAPTLENELKLRSSITISRENIRDLSNEMITSGKVSDRTLTLLEQERVKYQFFASMSDEIQYEYKAASDLIVLSDWGAKHLNLPTIIEHPSESPLIRKLFPENSFNEVMTLFQTATPQNPTISAHCCLRIKGKKHWYKIIGRFLWDEDTEKVASVFGKLIDIHDEQSQLEKIQKLAEQDSLTKLYNHAFAKKKIKKALTKKSKQYIMVLLGIDNFKQINDLCGHLFGDEIIKHMGQFLQKKLPPEAIISRVGGDMFLIFLEYTGDPDASIIRLFELLHSKYRGFEILCSMGAALAPEHDSDYTRLLHAADTALFAAKKSGKNCFRIYDESMRDLLKTPAFNE